MTDQQAFPQQDDFRAAVGAIAGADQAQTAVQWASRWVVRYLYVWGLGTLVFLPLTGLRHRQSLWVPLLWTAFVAGMFIYARRQRVVPAGATRLYLLAILSWSTLWAGALVLGLAVFPDKASFWISAGALASIPPFAAARAVPR